MSRYTLCKCPCPKNVTLLSPEELDRKVAEIETELTVVKAGLVSHVMRKTSVPDHRATSVSMGVLAGTFLFLVAASVVLCDLDKVVTYVRTHVALNRNINDPVKA